VLAEIQRHAFGAEKRAILLDETGLRLGQDAPEIVAAERLQFDADRQTSLQLRKEIRWLRLMEGTGSDEQDMIGPHGAVLGGHGGALDQRQELPLNAFAAHVAAAAVFAACTDLVDFVEKDDAVLLDGFDGIALDRVVV